ncbi:neprilysin-2-like isoform X2 [Leptopilina heterotoma]|uniref:neprilysin-2-like isoform X2 n=1 Tax=Leptopilina heterotoma TaxID=63436 RepID=UPI001CA9CF60|nr:neprilysin-2-like isoform X2 [Leptopilina heterotoma]
MINSELKNLDRRRRKLALKLGLSMLCLASLVNLSGAQNDTSQITSRVLKYMDTSIDPCDNFYKFACGQYIQSQIVSDKKYDVHNDFIPIHQKIQEQMKNIIEQDLKPTEPKYVKLMKTYYQNCINAEADNNDEEISKLFENFLTKIDGWRYLKDNSSEDINFQWEDFNSKLEKNLPLYEIPFFKLYLKSDETNNSNLLLHIKKPSNLLVLLTHFNIIRNISIDVHQYEIPVLDMFSMIIKINKVNKMLTEIPEPEIENRFDSNKRMTVKKLERKYSNISWRKIFNSRLHPFNEVRDDDIVVVSDISFFKKFNELINSVSKNDQAIFLLWGAIKNIFDKNYQISLIRENRMKFCFEDIKWNFPTVWGDLYVKNYFNETVNKKPIEEMFTNIFHQYATVLKNVDWLDNKTKDNALEKLASMYENRQIIFKVPTEKEFDEYYANLEITSGDYFQSILNITKFARELKASLFRVPLNSSNLIFRQNSADVRAINILQLNSIGISPGMLQENIFNVNRPMYMNYGSAGFMVAHEFSHGFDNQGRKFDKNGNSVDWWQATTYEQFISKAQCFISQYGNYRDEEVNLSVNSTLTEEENIADNEGLKLAYLAYQKWVEDHGPELLLPGINYTQPQLFWISFAQTFCEKASLFTKKRLLLNDVHTIKEFRVIGSVVNRPEFARDFQCPIGSKMNPESKCSLW